MDHLHETVENYLKKRLGYALLITGPWGAGKTHYWRETLEPLVKNTNTQEDDSKKYIPVYCSLFGVRSAQDIETIIFNEVFGIARSRNMKIAAGLLKTFASAITRSIGIEGYDKFEKEAENLQAELVDFQRIVICFDDLERVDDSFKIKGVLGFINQMVEHKKLKVIILANEGEIKDGDYKYFKEKLLGRTLEYAPSFEKIYPSFLERYYVGDPAYKIFLETKGDDVKNWFWTHSQNLRTLLFATQFYQDIHSEIMLKNQDRAWLELNFTEILDRTLHFTLVISIEFAKGEISFKKKRGLDAGEVLNYRFSDKLKLKVDTEKKEEYNSAFVTRYFPKSGHYVFIQSIFELITGGGILKKKMFWKEMKQIYPARDVVAQENQALLTSLIAGNHVQHSDKEYLLYLRKLKKAAFEGGFALAQYSLIYRVIIRFGNPLNLKLEYLVTRLKTGMRNAIKKANWEWDGEISFHSSSPAVQFEKDIYQFAIQLNKQGKKEREESKIQTEISSLSFPQWIQSKFSGKSSTPSSDVQFYFFKPKHFYRETLKLSNKDRDDLIKLIIANRENRTPEDLVFFEQLQFLLEEKESSWKVQNISRDQISEMIYVISELLS